MAEQKLPWTTKHGINVKGDSAFQDGVAFNGTVTFGATAKFIIPTHTASTGVENELRLNNSTKGLEYWNADSSSWEGAFIGGLEWSGVNSEFTIRRLADNADVKIPHVHKDNFTIENVGFLRTTEVGSLTKPALSTSATNMTRNGVNFITGGIELVGDAKSLGSATVTAFELKYGANGAVNFSLNNTAMTVGVASVFSETLSVNGAVTMANGATISNGDLEITSGNVTSGGNVIAFSDERIKDGFETVSNALERILTLEGVTYMNLVTGKREIGLKASQVERAFPDAVVETGCHAAPNEHGLMSDVKNIKAVAYGNLGGAYVEAFRVVDQRLSKLEKQLCSNVQDQ